MATVNSQTEVSDRVADILEHRRIGCEELTEEEWIQLIRAVLKVAIPFFRHLPQFHALGDGFKSFCVGQAPTEEGVRYFWLDDRVRLSTSYKSNTPAPAHFKVVRICRVSDSQDRTVSTMIFLSQDGEFVIADCQECASTAATTVTKVELLNSLEELKPYVAKYPQIGSRVLRAVEDMLQETYAKRMEQLENLKAAGERVTAISTGLAMGRDHYVEHWPWGYSDGSDRIIPRIGF